MRVVDTSVWIEWLIGSSLGRRLAKASVMKTAFSAGFAGDCVAPVITF